MKKLMAVLLLLITLASLALPCYANDAVIEITPPHVCPPLPNFWPQKTFDTLEEYQASIEVYLPIENFVPYEKISIFGDFSRSTVTHMEQTKAISYDVIDENDVTFTISPEAPSYDIHSIEEADLNLLSDMRSLQGTAYASKSELRVGNVCYIYGTGNSLIGVRFMFDDVVCEVTCTGSKLVNYPLDAQSTLMTRLLNPKTAEDAAEDLYDHLSGKAQMRRKALRITVLSVLTGVFVTVLAAFIIRKRTKNPHRFGGNEVDNSMSDAESLSSSNETTPPVS